MLDDEPAAVVERSRRAGVEWIMSPGVDAETSNMSESIATSHPDRVLWSAGLHPHQAGQWGEESEVIAEMASRAHAVGECGLDFYRNLAPESTQRDAFLAQIELAADLRKPVIIHCRDAFAAVHDILAGHDLGAMAVLHCWTGGPKWTKRFDELGVTFSFAGPITYSTADTLRRGAAQAPPHRTMVETDSPYLTPEPMRGAVNHPANVGLTGAALASVWGMSISEVAEMTTAAANRVFRNA
jgi:TatD DNase family protein